MDFKKLLNSRVLKIIGSVLIIVYLFKFVNFQLFFESLKNINYFIIFVIFIIPINVLTRAWRLMIILNNHENLISLKESCYLNLAGMALNIFMPASFGDIAKSYYGYKWHGIKEEMLSSSIFDKFMALVSLFILGALTAFIIKIYIMAFISSLLSIIVLLTIFYPQIMPWRILNRFLLKFLNVELNEEKLNESFSVSRKTKIKTFFISFFAWIILYFQFYLLCLSLSINIDFYYVLAVAPILNLALLFPFTLNGLGSGEAMVVYLFGLIGISPTLSILVSLLSQVFTIITGLFGFLIILKRMK